MKFNNEIEHLQKELEKTRKIVLLQTECLKMYAEENHWDIDSTGVQFLTLPQDAWSYAEEALKQTRIILRNEENE